MNTMKNITPVQRIYMHNMPWFLFYEYPVFLPFHAQIYTKQLPCCDVSRSVFIDSQEVHSPYSLLWVLPVFQATLLNILWLLLSNWTTTLSFSLSVLACLWGDDFVVPVLVLPTRSVLLKSGKMSSWKWKFHDLKKRNFFNILSTFQQTYLHRGHYTYIYSHQSSFLT